MLLLLRQGKLSLNIGLFQIDFPLQSYTLDFVHICCELGHSVTVYTTQRSFTGYVAPQLFPQGSLVILDHSLPAIVIDKVWRFLGQYTGNCISTISPLLRYNATLEVRTRCHDLFIGVEKLGLIIAGWVAREISKPVIYYSLELYIEGHPAEQNFSSLWREERYYHQLTAATLIQDCMRADVLFKANGLPSTARRLFLPVGVRSTQLKRKQVFLQSRLGIPYSVRIILYLGVISSNRNCQQIIDRADYLPSGYAIVFHGPLSNDPIRVETDNVFLSTDLLSTHELEAVVASADIGIAIYDNDVLNDRLTAFSSQKIAMYLRAGVPFVAAHNESYARLLSEFACGELIEEFAELPAAVHRILENYEAYSAAAHNAFRMHYCLDHTLPPVVKTLEELSSSYLQQTASDCYGKL